MVDKNTDTEEKINEMQSRREEGYGFSFRAEDLQVTGRNLSFLGDKKFVSIYKEMAENDSEKQR